MPSVDRIGKADVTKITRGDRLQFCFTSDLLVTTCWHTLQPGPRGDWLLAVLNDFRLIYSSLLAMLRLFKLRIIRLLPVCLVIYSASIFQGAHGRQPIDVESTPHMLSC